MSLAFPSPCLYDFHKVSNDAAVSNGCNDMDIDYDFQLSPESILVGCDGAPRKGATSKPTSYDCRAWMSDGRSPAAFLRMGWPTSISFVQAARSAHRICWTVKKPAHTSLRRWLNNMDRYLSCTCHDNRSANAKAIPLRRRASNTCISGCCLIRQLLIF